MNMARQVHVVRVEGMSCGHCVETVRQALDALASVEVAHVEIGEARITFDSETIDVESIGRAVEDVGFVVPMS